MQVHNMGTNSTPVLREAILLYGTGSNAYSFATVHPVEQGKKGSVPVIKAGTPVSKNGLLEALRILVDDQEVLEFPPAHVLAKGTGYLVWYRPPQRRTIWIDAEELGGKHTVEVPVPGLIWIAKPLQKSCYVFAYHGAERPDGNTVLCQAPFFNVWNSGQICEGNADVPSGPAAMVPENWEAMFWNSWFTHPNTPRLVSGKEGAYRFWANFIKVKRRVFPQAKLLSLKVTLGQAFKTVVMGGKT